MDKTLFELVPVSVKPDKEGWYDLIDPEGDLKAGSYYFKSDWWWEDENYTADEDFTVDDMFYLRPLPLPVAEGRTEVSQFLHDIAHDFDCDEDAHKYGTMCRACQARKLISQFNITLPE